VQLGNRRGVIRPDVRLSLRLALQLRDHDALRGRKRADVHLAMVRLF
jgi:hypothetical protein